MSARVVEIVTAYLLALSVVELPTVLIDVLAIPLPRLPFGMSWFTGVAVAVVLVLWPITRDRRRRIVGLWDAAYLSTLIVWTLLEAARGELNSLADVSAILAWVSPWVVSVAVRMHLSVFGDIRVLVRAFAQVVAVLAVGHLGLLLLARVGAPLPFMRLEEIVDRNSISLLIVAAAFVLALWDHHDPFTPSWWLFGIVVLGFAHAELNHARAAKLLLVLVTGMQMFRMALPSRRAMVRACVLLSVGMVAAVVGMAPLLEWLGRPGLFGSGDAAASTSFRVNANRTLLGLFVSHPWTGAGWSAVLNARGGGYIGHTLYLNAAAAYGIAGMLPVFAAMLWRVLRGPSMTVERAMTLALITAVASFVNDPIMWYGLVLALPPQSEVQRHASSELTNRIAIAHLRPYYGAAAAVALGLFAVLGMWVLQRDRYVASTELQIAQAGAYQLEAVESSSEAEEFVQLAVFQSAPELRDRCSVSGRVESQALVVQCKGRTEQDAVRALDLIIPRILRRHELMFESRKHVAGMISPVDRSVFNQLNEWIVILESLDEPVVGGRRDQALLTYLKQQRDTLRKNLANYERGQKLEHPSRLVGGVRITERTRPWALCVLLAASGAITVLLSLGIGAATRAAILGGPAHSAALREP